MSDLNIKMTVRNGRLLRAVRDTYGTGAELCRVAGVSETHLSALMTMRASPFREDGSLTNTAEAIVSALGVPADDLWPAHVARLKAKRATVEVEMSAQEFAAIADDDLERGMIYRDAIAKWSEQLTDRQRTALTVHHSGGTLDEVGEAIGGVSRERARQIIAKSERIIRAAARQQGVEKWSDI